MHSFLGLVRGFPVLLSTEKFKGEGSGGATFGVYTGWSTGGMPKGASEEIMSAALVMTVSIATRSAGAILFCRTKSYEEDVTEGTNDLFQRPWEEIVGNGKHWNEQGNMVIQLTITTIASV